jgi:hypothetical protein
MKVREMFLAANTEEQKKSIKEMPRANCPSKLVY